MHELWRWMADQVLPSCSYTSHLHPQHGEHVHHDPLATPLWRPEVEGRIADREGDGFPPPS